MLVVNRNQRNTDLSRDSLRRIDCRVAGEILEDNLQLSSSHWEWQLQSAALTCYNNVDDLVSFWKLLLE